MVDYPARIEADMLMENEPYNAADKKHVNNARKKEARLRREELDYIRHIMSTKEGRKWICNIIALGDPLVIPYGPGNTTEHTHVNIGKQFIPAKLMMDIRLAAPDEYVKMLVEALDTKK